jgi:hypothetical protein
MSTEGAIYVRGEIIGIADPPQADFKTKTESMPVPGCYFFLDIISVWLYFLL